MTQLTGKVTLITGAAMGIGAAAAQLLADAGATLIITDINAEAGQETADNIAQSGGRVHFRQLNATTEEQWQETIEWVMADFGGLDVLVNNAGIFRAKAIENSSLEEWHQVMDTNIDSVFLGMKHSLPAMKERAQTKAAGHGGSIVNISSISAQSGTPCALAYTASKAAVAHMTKSAAMEFCALGYNIRVNSILPGMIQTPLLQGLLKDMAGLGAFGTDDPAQLEQMVTTLHPIGRLGNPEEIAKGVLFLAGDDSSYMTGSELIIDGGYIAR